MWVTSDSVSNILWALKDASLQNNLCFAHMLNTIVQHALQSSEALAAVRKVKDLVKAVHESSKAANELWQIQTELEKPNVALIQEVEMRWNSTYDMLARVQDHKDDIRQLMLGTKSEGLTSVEPIFPRDWKWIEFAVDVLKPVLDATKKVSGEKYITGSIVLPEATSLLAFYKQTLNETGLAKEEKDFIAALHAKMIEEFCDIEDMRVLTIPALLEPQFKKFGFGSSEKLQAAMRRLKTRNGRSPSPKPAHGVKAHFKRNFQ